MKSTYAYFSLAALLIIFSVSPVWADLSVKGAVFETYVSPGTQISHEMIFSLVLRNESFKFYSLSYDKDHGKKETAQC
jgi:hypothetical protein